MKPTTFLALLLTGASAATLPQRLPPTRPRDAPQHRLALLHTLTPSAPSGNARLSAAGVSSSNAEAESTKGGAILTLPAGSDASAISSAQGTFRVPVAQMPTAGPTANNTVGVYAASFWVGMDSANPAAWPGCAPLRAGVDIFYDGTLGGTQNPFAWYQFGSAPATGFGGEGLGVSAGDLVRFTLSVSASSPREAVVLAENFGGNVSCANPGATPLRSVRQALPVGEGALMCGREAAWIVEDFPLAGLPNFPVALANFTSVTFGAAGVTLADGSERNVAGAEALDVRLQAQGGRLTSCEVVGGKKVKCTRVVGDN